MISNNVLEEINEYDHFDLSKMIDICSKLKSGIKCEMTYEHMLFHKLSCSPQKFSPWFQKEFSRFMGYKSLSRGHKFDMSHMDLFYEQKYATETDESFSFPQFLRIGTIPELYYLILFSNEDSKIIKLSYDQIINSILFENLTNAHNDNDDEKALRFKNNGIVMDYINENRDIELEALFKNFTFIIK